MRRVLKMVFIVIGGFVGLLLIIGVLFINLSPEFGARAKGAQLEVIQQSPQYKDGKFQNIEKTEVMKSMDYSTIPEYFTNRGNKIPDWSIPVEKLNTDYFSDYPDSLTRVTWFGHSALLLEIDGKKIFLDPMLGNVPAPHPWLGTPRFNDTLPMAIDMLPELDAVVISHDHYDHLDYGSIMNLKDKVGQFFVPLGVGAHLVSWGVDDAKIRELDWWEESKFEGLTLVATPARHFSGRGLFDRASTLWSSWVVIGENDRIFFGGDSGYDSSFKKIGEQYGPFDFAMLECGQYNEQWSEIHMMPEETVQAGIDLQSHLLMPIHWGAFKLALHPWDEPVRRFRKEAAQLGARIATPVIGEPIVLHEEIPTSRWWEKQE